MDKLQELLDKFRNDESWNTENRDGTHRFDETITWIEQMILDYAEKLNIPVDDVVDLMESKRTYSWPNYYQKANFPGIESDFLYGIWDTFEAFRNDAKTKWAGFRCPRCGDVSTHPQECTHRLKKDGKCDWCAFGLFRSRKGVIIKKNGLDLIPIFEPVPKEARHETDRC